MDYSHTYLLIFPPVFSKCWPPFQVEWDIYSRQGMYLFRQPFNINKDFPPTLRYSTTFQPLDGMLNFEFGIEVEGREEG